MRLPDKLKPALKTIKAARDIELPPWVKKHKKAVLITAGLPVAIPLLYIADVWAIGSLAAFIHDISWSMKAFNVLASPEEIAAAKAHSKMMPYVLEHPVQTGLAWLKKPDGELIHPDVRNIWRWLNLFLTIPVAAGVIFLRKHKQNKNNSNMIHGLKIVNNSAYGTSRWASLKDLKSFCEFGPPVSPENNPGNKIKFPGGNLIGELEGKIVRVNFEKMPTVLKNTPKTAPHCIAYGGTGSGKSFSFVSSNIVAAAAEGQSLVVIDPKGELFTTFAKWLKKKGYENVWALNFMTPEHSHRWNPVLECENDAEISEMVDTLSRNAASDSKSYFMLKAMELMEAFIGLLKGDFPIEQQHMRSIMTLSAWPAEKLEVRFRDAYKAGKISSTIYERWRGVVKENYGYAQSNLTAVLKNLTTDPLAALLSEQEIKLDEIGKKKTALFLIIPTSGEGVYLRPILSIFYKFLFKRLDKLAFNSPGQTLPVKVRNIWDEMANVGMIPGLPEIISTARSKGIHIQMILQTPSQLEYVYGVQEAKTILGNCPTVMLIGIAPADSELAKMFSEKLGSAAVEAEHTSEDTTVPIKHVFELKKKTRTIIERPLMTVSEILRIGPKDCIALLQWSYPAFLRKIGWTELPQAKEIISCGMLPVNEFIPARNFNVSKPDVDGENSFDEKQTNSFSEPLLFSQKKTAEKVSFNQQNRQHDQYSCQVATTTQTAALDDQQKQENAGETVRTDHPGSDIEDFIVDTKDTPKKNNVPW
ncbi:VirD4-like conjugal transfer protein, CD1115 family [Desulfotomaculum nigrificans]|uniref:VirD4-like conjugal transfer protein, CD1115 family n=1 Tax=Desulfotomaculum nigrificans TaxID=1565 RepID=UPI0001FAE5AE|nr:type IV secretory system conjugative DNA transfer family protein [Desulfotomaculum nigrificans]